MIPFLDEYRKGNYEAALLLAHRIVSTSSFWGPLARAVANVELGNTQDAKQDIETLLKRVPHFFSSSQTVLERYLHNPVLFQKIFQSLKKIGCEFT